MNYQMSSCHLPSSPIHTHTFVGIENYTNPSWNYVFWMMNYIFPFVIFMGCFKGCWSIFITYDSGIQIKHLYQKVWDPHPALDPWGQNGAFWKTSFIIIFFVFLTYYRNLENGAYCSFHEKKIHRLKEKHSWSVFIGIFQNTGSGIGSVFGIRSSNSNEHGSNLIRIQLQIRNLGYV